MEKSLVALSILAFSMLAYAQTAPEGAQTFDLKDGGKIVVMKDGKMTHMDATGKTMVEPHDDADSSTDESILGLLQSGYVKRGSAKLPRQGRHYPWQVTNHLGRDMEILLKMPVADHWLQFSEPPASPHRQQRSNTPASEAL